MSPNDASTTRRIWASCARAIFPSEDSHLIEATWTTLVETHMFLHVASLTVFVRMIKCLKRGKESFRQ